MKKTLILTLFCVILSNCEIKPRQAEAQSEITTKNNFYGGDFNDYRFGYQYHEEERDGMKYGIWSKKPQTHHTGYTVAVVNLTKEALEVELLKLQISETHKRLNQNP